MTDVMRRGATTATATAIAYNRDLFPGLRVRAHTHFLDERRTRRRLGDWPWTFTRPIVQGHSDFSADGTPSTPTPTATSAIFTHAHTHIRRRFRYCTFTILDSLWRVCSSNYNKIRIRIYYYICDTPSVQQTMQIIQHYIWRYYHLLLSR